MCAGDGHVGAQVGWERRYLSRFNGTLADGTLLVTPTVVDVAHTAPVVVIDPHAGASPLPTVASQNLEGAMTATDYLIGLGHRRIGFIAGRPDLESARLREKGYLKALKRSGIEATETDLAEFIIQLAGEASSHILVPAIHKNRSEIR